ncbi:MAG TPA: iron-containing alcohol dehydrogenase [Patescibacteria group bacterium]|nr:iron-containing alcohol dehydrogenase [Patescibacteria group bacterium]
MNDAELGQAGREPTGHIDPTDLDAVRRAVGLDAPGTALHPIGMTTIRIGPNAVDELTSLVASVARPGPIAVVVDAVPMRRGTHELKSLVSARLGSLGEVRVVTVGVAGAEVHADPAAVEDVTARVAGAGCVVAVGSGTVCDIAKEASRAADAPYVVVQSANSVNAFSDDMAVLLLNGVKRTVPSRWPDVLVVDLAVLGDTPAALNRAGVGELAAMFTAPADWRLAGAFGMDSTWDRRVVDLFRDGAAGLLAAAPLATTRDHAAQRTLAELMTLSGLALGIAGRTSPISGTEHTVSHLLDMAAAREGRRTGLHGAQVGVAALAVAVAWERFLDTFDPGVLLDAGVPTHDAMRTRIDEAFRSLDPTGAMATECWTEYRRKLGRWDALRGGLPAIVEGWPAINAELRQMLGHPADIAAALRSAGAAATFDELDPPASRAMAGWALFNGHLIRDRFTLADLAWFSGTWTAEVADAAIAEAARIAGAAAVDPVVPDPAGRPPATAAEMGTPT